MLKYSQPLNLKISNLFRLLWSVFYLTKRNSNMLTLVSPRPSTWSMYSFCFNEGQHMHVPINYILSSESAARAWNFLMHPSLNIFLTTQDPKISFSTMSTRALCLPISQFQLHSRATHDRTHISTYSLLPVAPCFTPLLQHSFILPIAILHCNSHISPVFHPWITPSYMQLPHARCSHGTQTGAYSTYWPATSPDALDRHLAPYNRPLLVPHSYSTVQICSYIYTHVGR